MALTRSLSRSSAPAQVVVAAGSTIERVVDTVGTLLSGFPASPISELLSGALWLTRRAVFPTSSTVESGGSVACVVADGCSGRDLRAANAVGEALNWADIGGADVHGAIVTATTLTDAALSWADRHTLDLYGVPLTAANLAWANLTWPALTGSTLTGDDLTSAFLVLVYLALAYLTLANLTGTTLTGADLKRLKLAYANLIGAGRADGELKRPTLYLANPNSVVTSASLDVPAMADVLPAFLRSGRS